MNEEPKTYESIDSFKNQHGRFVIFGNEPRMINPFARIPDRNFKAPTVAHLTLESATKEALRLSSMPEFLDVKFYIAEIKTAVHGEINQVFSDAKPIAKPKGKKNAR